MNIVFKTKNMENKKMYSEADVIVYDPDNEQRLHDVLVKAVDKIVPMYLINQSNIYQAGYIPEDNRMIIHFQSMRKSVEGFELGVYPEPFDYVYDGIEQNVFDGFLHSKDKVEYFNNNIKGNYIYHREEVWC